jgi:hypothetical protein
MCQLVATLVDGHLDGRIDGLEGEVMWSTDHFGGAFALPCASGSELF